MNIRAWAVSVLAVAGIICTILMIVRWIAAFRGGPYIFTSGGEGESLFSIWKNLRGEKVYANPFDPPFAASYYNWMFYWTYGFFATIFSPFLGIGSALPSISRLLTVLLTLASAVLVYALLAPLNPLRRIVGSLVVALNPLIGFWSVTARPDMGALLCDLAGLWCVMKAGRSSTVWLIPALAAFYGAWAFKQYFVAGLVAACVYLVVSGRHKQAFLLGGGAAVAFAATLVFGDAEYRYALLQAQSDVWFSPLLAVHNCLGALVKAPLFAVGLASILVSIRKTHLNLLAMAGLISFAVMLPASAKAGASDDYFFESATMCSIAFLLAWPERSVLAGALAQIVSPALIFGGLAGELVAQPKPELSLLEPTLRQLPAPVIVTVAEGNLPWFQEKPPHFLVAYTYAFDRRQAKPFAFDGIAGMIRSGLIKVLVCPRTSIYRSFHGVVPASFPKLREDSYWSYFDTAAGR